MTFIIISVIAALLIFAGLISATETAITATSPGKIQQLISEGNKRAKLIKSLLKIKSKIISTLLIGNSIANTLCTTLATSIFIDILGDDMGTIVSSIVMSFMIIVFSEVVPKAIAVAKPEKFALMSGPALVFFMKILYPVNVMLAYIVKIICFIFRIDLKQDVSADEEVRGIIDHHISEGRVVKGDGDMLGGVLNIRKMTVEDIMTHRSHINSIDINASPEAVVKYITSSKHSRIPVWQGEKDNVVGILHIRDLLNAIQEKKGDIKSVKITDLITIPWFVPNNALVMHQLHAFRERQSHLACVVNEYGELQGIVTLEDTLEPIVGQIDDEHDIGNNKITKHSVNEYTVDGLVAIRDINRELDWNLPEGEATTIAGLFINEMQRIPNKGDWLILGKYKFVVKSKSANRIKTIKIFVLDQAGGEE